MAKKLLLFALLACSYFCHAQLMIDNTLTPAQLLQTSFLDGSVTVSNIKFNGTTVNAEVLRDQVAGFNTNFNPTNLGVTHGMILATGKSTVAYGPNNNDNETQSTAFPFYGDPDLATMTTSSVTTKAVLEFDFVASGDLVAFQYIFASEEYPEYVNTQFNDVFGIFLSGPGITGPYLGNAKNIALIPSTSVPISINNINNGTTNVGPCDNCSYYVNNGIGTTPGVNTSIQYDGFTVPLTASSSLIPGETYHIKFAIANVSDNTTDSAVFLKAGSFSTPLKTVVFTKDGLQVFPNPAHTHFEVRLDGQQMASVNLYNVTGALCKQFAGIDADQFKADVSNLPKGFYTVEIETKNQTRLIKKLILE